MTKRVKTAGVFYNQNNASVVSKLIDSDGLSFQALQQYDLAIPTEAKILFDFIIEELPGEYIKELSAVDFSSKLNKYLSSHSSFDANQLSDWLIEQFPSDQLDYQSVSFLMSYYYYQSLMNCLEQGDLTVSQIEAVGLLEPLLYSNYLAIQSNIVSPQMLAESAGIKVACNFYQDKQGQFDAFHLITPLYYQQKYLKKAGDLLIDCENQTNLIFLPSTGPLQVNFCKAIQDQLIGLSSDKLTTEQTDNFKNLLAEITFYLEQLNNLPKTIYLSNNYLGALLQGQLALAFSNLNFQLIELEHSELTAFVASKLSLQQPYLYSSQNRFKLPLPGGEIIEIDDFPYDVV